MIADNIKKELHQFGTGTLLKVADVSLLVTAAHVVTLAKDHGIPLLISSGGSFTQLDGNWCYSSDDTPFDVAILRLPEDVASQLSYKNSPTICRRAGYYLRPNEKGCELVT